jgi:hypothetical protein
VFTFVKNYNSINHEKVMSKPIKETPVLKGKDARVFMARITSPSKREAISDLTRRRMRENFEKINSIVKP